MENKQYVNINFHYFWLILEIQIKVLVWELAFFFFYNCLLPDPKFYCKNRMLQFEDRHFRHKYNFSTNNHQQNKAV